MSLELEAPIPGTLGWELISLVSDYVNEFASTRVLEVRDDKLMVYNCKELGRLIAGIVNKHVTRDAHVFISGNDFRYTLGTLARLAGLSPKPPVRELIESYGRMMQRRGCQIRALTELYAVPAMLNVNFYEYGKRYLKKPTKQIKPKLRISGGAVILGYLGGLLCYAGNLIKPETRVSFYFIPQRRIIDWPTMEEITGKHQQLITRDYSDASILIYLTSILFEKGVTESDTLFGSMVSLQEAQRPTVLSVNSMHTSGLIRMMNRMKDATGLQRKRIASSLRSFISAPTRIGGEERNALMRLVERFSSYLLAYASTKSPEPLLMLVSLLDRTLGELQLGSRSALSNGLRIWAGSSLDAIKRIRFLIELLSSTRFGI